MANKKILMSVTATAAIASFFVATDESEAAQYKVKSGDTLWSIAQSNNTSVSNLISINNLSGNTIFPNQVLDTISNTNNQQAKPTPKPKPTSSANNTYTVKAGDTLSSIASRHSTSYTNLMKLNNLDTTLIYPGNVLVVNSKGASSNTSDNSSNTGGTVTAPPATSSTYVVKSGDTLSAIASRNKVSVANIKSWNNLSSDVILIGQKLSLNGNSAVESKPANNSSTNNAPAPPTTNSSFNVTQLISAAKSVVGTKYVWGGSSKSGFDCSGFIHFAYNNAGMKTSRLSTDGYYDRSFYVDNPQLGDLVFFKDTYRSGISHMGIYIGANQFIHAGSSTGVTISSLDNSYWKKHYDGFKRFY